MKNLIQLSNIKLILIYSLYTFFVFNFPLINSFYKTLAPHSIQNYFFLFSIGIIGLIGIFIFFTMIWHRWIAYIFLIINSVIFYFTYSYNVLIDTQMLANFASTDAHEVQDLLSFKMLFFILSFGIAPSILLHFVNVIKSSFKKKIIYIMVCLLIALTLFLVNFINSAGFFRVNRNFGYMFSPFNYLYATFELVMQNTFKAKSRSYLEIADLTIDANQNLNLVLIVGETARRKNFSLYGYERNTNPELAKISNLHIIQNTISCGTSTKISVPCIFQIEQKYQNILIALQKAGAKIKWYENNFGGCYGMCAAIPTFISDHSKCDGSCPDGVIFEEFFKDLKQANSGVNIFVLHQNGSHGPLYYKRYPTDFAHFTPECTSPNVSDCSLKELVNAYDNSILYTDFLISSTIQELQKQKINSTMIYISDHGESLGENGIFLHGFPYKLAPKEQIEIPYLIWSSSKIKIKLKTEYSHQTVAHSILHLLKAKSEIYNEKENILQ